MSAASVLEMSIVVGRSNRAAVVDAKDETVARFYEAFGFVRESNSFKLFMKVSDIDPTVISPV